VSGLTPSFNARRANRSVNGVKCRKEIDDFENVQKVNLEILFRDSVYESARTENFLK
jgi:hypothetical protein